MPMDAAIFVGHGGGGGVLELYVVVDDVVDLRNFHLLLVAVL